MEVGAKGVLLFVVNIVFNLYTFYLLSHVYSIQTSHVYNCKLRGGKSSTANSSTTHSSPNLAEIVQTKSQVTVQIEPLQVEPVPSYSEVTAGEIEPVEKSPGVELDPDERGVEEFVVMVPSAKRPGKAFYLSQCVNALLRARVPASAIIVMNAGVDSHDQLDAYLTRLERNGQKVKRVVRTYNSADLSVDNLKDFPFQVKPVERTDVGAQVAGKDPEDRKRWRSKEAMDFVYISRNALREHERTQWFVFLQDDAVLRAEVDDLFHSLRSAIASNPTIPVFHLNKLGNVALMFHRRFLESYVAFASLRFDLMPIDWLLGKQKHAMGTKDKLINMFRHVGLKSSFAKNDRSHLVQ